MCHVAPSLARKGEFNLAIKNIKDIITVISITSITGLTKKMQRYISRGTQHTCEIVIFAQCSMFIGKNNFKEWKILKEACNK